MADDATIRELIATWHRATADKDPDVISGLMDEDAVFLRAGGPPMRGREAFATSFRQVTGKFRIVSSSDVKEVVVDGDLAYAWSHLTVTMTPVGGGAPMRRTGDVLTVYRKRDGRWLLFRDANLLSEGT